MGSKINRKYISGTLWCLFLFSAVLNSQSYRFKTYGSESSIPNNFIYSIIQDDNRYLWIGTGSGLSKFDGFDFYNIAYPDSATDRNPVVSLKDKNGNLWFGCDDGSVYYTAEGILKALPLPGSRAISTMLSGPDGYIYIVPQGDQFFRVSPDTPHKINTYPLDNNLVLISACFTESGNILIGSQENILICEVKNDSVIISGVIKGFNYSNVTAIHKFKDKDIFYVGTNGNGLFRLDLNDDTVLLSKYTDHPVLENLIIQSATEDRQGNLWLSTDEYGVIRLTFTGNGESIETLDILDKNAGLPGNNARLVYEDIEGNYWIGLFGDGLSVLNSLAFSLFTPGETPETNNIIYVNMIDDLYFLGTPSGFYLFDAGNNTIKSFTDLKQKTGNNEISSYFVDSGNNVWIGTKGAGLYLRNPSGAVSRFYRTGNSGEDYITDLEADSKYLWLGTVNGVIILDRKTGGFVERYNINNGLPHNYINQIFITKSGEAAVATKSDRLYMIDPEKGITSFKAMMSGTTLNEISSFCQSDNGNLWASTIGNGVFKLMGDSLKSYTRNNMLMSDYCYSILSDSSGRIWIGHERGFSRYNPESGVMRTYGADFVRGGSCNTHGMYESSDGKIFIGTTSGFIIYDREKDRKPFLAPFNNINSVTINDVKFPYRSSYNLPYRKRYNIWVDYIGINLRDPDKVFYQTMLENYDEWSEVSVERRVPYSPGDGRYTFFMQSVNEDGLTQDTPVSFDINIKKPFWRSWWFFLSSVIIIAGIVIIIVKEREKAQKKIQVYLEKELEARTSVMMKQKVEIELQNIEITDSINYAKRIQTSILPDFNKLKEACADAFLFFRPRDIVSGDFYWFDKFDEDKYIIVCADSTGHGVPGAFMSMIGSTLLQDIVTRQRITKPSVVLKMLDNQIFTTLNQNIELGISNDGMDVIVCEVNIKTRHIRFASAMRPVILFLGGETLYVKGNRSSVGGESVIEKYFDDQEYFLSESDSVYMFSDGLPDQFGGPAGKKMKIARLRRLIEDVAGFPMREQEEVITKFFDEWKGEFDQVDDVLLIGIKL